MFKTKRDVDRHVTHIVNRLRDEKERHSRGFQFAKLYYDVSDYESSKKYVQAFLSVRQAPQAHKLLGQVYEALKDKTKAIEAYQRSLDLDPEQKDLVLKVCELYSDPSVKVNADNAKFWIEKAEKVSPDDHRVFKLKERVIDKDGSGNSEELERLVCSELMRNPGDVQLHIKLLKMFIESRQVDRAYDHATATEKSLGFVASADWYECLCDVFQVYQDQQGTREDQAFYTNKLFALASLTLLRLQADDRDMLGPMNTLHQFDQDLYEGSCVKKQSSEWENFLTEMKGQLFYLMALLLLKRALKGQVKWRDASTFGTICFLLSDSLPAVELKSSWFKQLSQERHRFYSYLHQIGCDRLSQGGHIIYSLLNKQTDKDWARKLRQKLCTPQGRDSLYALVFNGSELQRKKNTSYFLQSDLYTSTSLDVPSKSKLVNYDSMAFNLHRGSLRHLVWLAMQYHTLKDDIQPDYEQLFCAQLFQDTKYSVADLSGGDPGSLCQLDAQVFLYVCVRWACIQQRDQRRSLHTIPDKPDLLPVCLASTPTSSQQCEWWSAVYKMETSTAREKLAKVWGVVMRGLETVRLVLPNSLPVALVVHLARTLDTRAKEIESLDAEGIVTPKLAAMQARASFYWKAASDVVQRVDRNQSLKQPKEMLFPLDAATDKEFTKDLRERVQFALALVAMREGDLEQALQGFEGLYTASASYYTGMIYRNLAEASDENANSSGGGQNINQRALLTKAKNAYYTTLDRIETSQDEEELKLKEPTKLGLDDVENKLLNIESGGHVVDSFCSPATFSTPQSESDDDDEPIKQPSPRTPVLPTPSRSWEQVRMSPTRLDVQLRALEHTNTAVSSRLSTIEETVRTQEKLIQELFSQLREYRDENNTLKAQMQVVQDSVQNVATLSMAARPGMPPQYPTTPQQRSAMMNAMNASFGAAQYDYTLPSGLPPHMSQYAGYPGGSPRPGSAYGQQNLDEDFSNIDGQFYMPDEEDEYNIPDQNLIQEWPFGNKPGLEGKSTITYSPQHQARGVNQGNAVFANVFRGQSIQYGGYQPQVAPQQVAPQLPGPGFFSQHSQQTVPVAMQSQAGRFPVQPQVGLPIKPGTSPALSPSIQPPRPAIVSQAQAVGKPATPMMPPNAVASNMAESKPLLNPSSVGVPSPVKKEEVAPAVSQTGLTPQSGQVPQPRHIPQPGLVPASVPSAAGTKPSLLPASSLTGQGQGSPGAAASMLSQLAAKHQETANTGQVSTPQKTVFQGFTFSSTPKITETNAEKPKEEVKVATTTAGNPKPFSGFSFTTPTQSSAKTPTTQTQPSPSSFGSLSTPSTFGNLAAGGQVATGFGGAGGDFRGFAGAGQTLFNKSPSPRRRNPSIGSEDHVDEYEPNVDFQPVVPLPDLVEVKTGEEDEIKLFGERAKLFRFDKESNQWKERGVGEMKVLQHNETKVCRILMRREQVLKLCANHNITKDIKLFPMSSSEKAWIWSAPDFSDGEVKYEKLAVRFKNQDIAEKFKKTVEECQEKMNKPADQAEKTDKRAGEPTKKKEGKSETAEKKPEAAASGQKGNLASLFKPKEGSWTCTGCYVQSNSDVLKCPCCNSLKPGVTKEDLPAEKAGSSGSSGFSFGSQPAIQTNSSGGFNLAPANENTSATNGQKGNLASLFKPKEGSWTCTGCYVQNNSDVLKCPCCNSLKPGVTKEDLPAENAGSSGFSFGSQQAIQTNSSGGFNLASMTGTTAATSSEAGGFKFGTQSTDTAASSTSGSGFAFGTPAATSTAAPQTGGFMFGTQSSGATTSTGTSASSFPFGTPSTATSTAAQGGLFGGGATSSSSSAGGFSFGGDASKGIAAPQQSTSSAQSEVTLPQPCTPSSGFTFGGAATKVTDDSTAVSSAGFNVNKDATKYTFGEAAKSKDEPSKDAPKKDMNTSLLAQYLSAPDTNVQEVSSTTSDTGKEEQKPLFGGNTASKFTFGNPASTFSFCSPSTPAFTVGSAVNKEEVEEESHQKKPGSNPTTPVQQTEGFKFNMTPSKDTDQPQPAAKLGGGFHFSLNMTPGMPPKTSPIKSPGVTSPRSPEVTDDGLYVTKEGDDSHIHFEPIVQLPDKVDVTTGEEGEEVIFSHRAKLYRFTKDEWKERGLGDVKVLLCPDTNKARILMRREQILKLCCNHYITPELKFKEMPKMSGKVLSWFAMDFSDGEARPEKLSIRFKTADIAADFQKAVEDAKQRTQSNTHDAPSVPAVETIGATAESTSGASDEVSIVKEEKATAEEIAKARELMLPDHFYLYRLKPPCPGCRGCKDDTVTESDQVPVQAEEEEEEYEEDDDDDEDEYDDEETEEDDDDDEDYDDEDEEEEAAPTSGGDMREIGTGEQLLARLLSTDEPPTQAGIFSGGSFSSVQDTGPAKPEPSGFVFGESSVGGISFASVAGASSGPVGFQKDDNKPFHWHGAGQQLFGGGARGKEDGSGDEEEVQEGAEPHFEPIVPLPELIEVKTGEEDETKEFCQRAKLFRYDAEKKEWKEKGIGEMKILKHKETGKYRFLLRREQVHKLACNHLLTPDLNIQPMSTSETAWCWLAQDYSENELKVEKLAVKFKNIELAKSFKVKVDEIQALLREAAS